jgi:hypothetical protein
VSRDPIKYRKISLLAPFGKERHGDHDGELFRRRRGNELIDA